MARQQRRIGLVTPRQVALGGLIGTGRDEPLADKAPCPLAILPDEPHSAAGVAQETRPFGMVEGGGRNPAPMQVTPPGLAARRATASQKLKPGSRSRTRALVSPMPWPALSQATQRPSLFGVMR
jgi:hypothetical protein